MTDREKLIELLCVDPCIAMSMEDCQTCKLRDEGNCYSICMADHLISHGVTFAKNTDAHSKWNSVEEGLPEKDGTYIVRSDANAVYTSHFYAERSYPNGFVRQANWTKRGKVKVTHWMPLPKWEE